MERNKRSLLINCIAGLLAAAITLFFMLLGGVKDAYLVVIPLTVLVVAIIAAFFRYRAGLKNPQAR